MLDGCPGVQRRSCCWQPSSSCCVCGCALPAATARLIPEGVFIAGYHRSVCTGSRGRFQLSAATQSVRISRRSSLRSWARLCWELLGSSQWSWWQTSAFYNILTERQLMERSCVALGLDFRPRLGVLKLLRCIAMCADARWHQGFALSCATHHSGIIGELCPAAWVDFGVEEVGQRLPCTVLSCSVLQHSKDQLDLIISMRMLPATAG